MPSTHGEPVAGPSGQGGNEDCDDDKGTVSEMAKIKEGFEFVRTFLDKIKQRKEQEDDPEVTQYICKINKEISEMMTNDKGKEKIRREIKRESDSSSSSSSESSESDSSSSERESSSDNEEERRKKMKKKKMYKNFKEITDEEKFYLLLERMDNRSMPELEPFDEESVETLGEFIKNFEEYYSKNFKGNKQLRIRALEKLFTGRILDSFKAIRKVEKDYSTIKRKLLRWYDGEKEARKYKAKKKFEKATVKENESMLMYSNRLMSLFKLAFPKKNAEKSDTLVKKFCSTVPRKMRNLLNNQMYNCKLSGKQFKWNKLQKCAMIYDGTKENEKSDGESEEIIEVNLTEAARRMNNNHKKYDYNDNNNNYYKRYDNNHKSHNNNKYNFQNQQYNDSKPRSRMMTWNKPPTDSVQTCQYCGRFGHKISECRKKLGSCFKCGNLGHMARDCFKKPYEGRRHSVSPNHNRNNNRHYRNYSQNPESKQQQQQLNY